MNNKSMKTCLQIQLQRPTPLSKANWEFFICLFFTVFYVPMPQAVFLLSSPVPCLTPEPLSYGLGELHLKQHVA